MFLVQMINVPVHPMHHADCVWNRRQSLQLLIKQELLKQAQQVKQHAVRATR